MVSRFKIHSLIRETHKEICKGETPFSFLAYSADNCITWALKKLKRLGINLTSHNWFPIYRPEEYTPQINEKLTLGRRQVKQKSRKI